MSVALRILFIIFFCALNQTAPAQTSQKDSLYRLVRFMPEDTNKINVYLHYGLIMEDIHLDSAAFYYKKIKTISDRFNYLQGKFKYASNYSAVLNLQGKFSESYPVNKEALNLARTVNQPEEIAKALTNLGNVHNYEGHYDSALTYYLEAASVFEKVRDTIHLNVLYQNISVVFDALDQYDRSLEYAFKSIKLSEAKKDSLTLSSVLNNAGNTFTSLKKYDSALALFNRALIISKNQGIAYNEQMTYLGIGELFTKMKDFNKAIQNFQKSLDLSAKMEFTNNVASSLNGLAMCYFKIGNYRLADQYGIRAMNISEKSTEFTDLRQQYKLMASVKAKLGEYSNAYDYLEKYMILNDSLSGIEIKKSVAGLERKYQSAKKDKALLENRVLIVEKEKNIRQKGLWLLLAFSMVFILAILLFLARNNYKQKKKFHLQKVEAMQKEQEVVRLKATLDGQQQERLRIAKEIHDEIGSGLTGILFLANSLQKSDPEEEKSVKISHTATQLISQMNEIVWAMNSGHNSLEELVSYLRHNISEQLNTVGIDYDFDIPDNIPETEIGGIQRRNIYLVVKEAIHNIIKHSGANKVTVNMKFTDGISIILADNGKGMPAEVKKSFGNGLKNMQFRMEQIGGEWDITHQGSVVITLKLPLKQFI